MPIKKNYNKDFFKSWSDDMAYILGFLFADGNIIKTKRDTHFVAVYSADKALLESMRSVIESEHVVQKRSTRSGNVYRIQIGSKKWYSDLLNLGLVPGKASRMRIPDIPKKYQRHFIRGYFDGDGNVWTGEIHKERLTPTRTIQVAFTCASHGFLSDLEIMLKNLGIIGGSLYRSKSNNFSRLSFSKKDALKIYEIMYNATHKLYLERKKSVFETFVNNTRR